MDESLRNMNLVIDTNFRGLLLCTRRAFKLMSKSNDFGLIININSVCGHFIPHLDFSFNVYGATKFAVTALTETIRQELFRSGNRKVRIAVSINTFDVCDFIPDFPRDGNFIG